MANRDIIDIFDECIDRLAAGQDIDTILSDYPAEAEPLRGLLETGLLVYQIQNETPGVDEARSRGRGKLEEAMSEMEIDSEKPKRKARPIQWIVFASAAVFAMMLGIGIGIGSGMRPAAEDARQGVYDVGVVLTATAIIDEATQMALNPTVVPPVDDMMLTATQIIAEVSATAQAENGNPFPLFTVTAVPSATSERDWCYSTCTPTPQPSATTTATATGTPLPSATALPTLGPVTTSVASMDMMTATPGGGVDAGGVQLTATALALELDREVGASSDGLAGGALGTPLPPAGGVTALPGTPTPESLASVPGMPDAVMTSTASYVVISPETPGDADGRIDEESGEPLEPPAVIIDSTTTGTTVIMPTPVPNFSQVQLQPLKAGEIDDNANWDTYTLYRRNFLEMYGGLIIDVDITGRQIIKVVDTAGRPVLGAKVEVFYGTQPVSSTLTYATGMTLFFPNAKPEFRRIDTFRVVVTKDTIVTETTLNTERIDDILTITLGR